MTTTSDTISQLLAARAASQPDHVMVSLPDRDLTFGELDETADRMANVLAAVGTGVGERCAVMLPNGQPFLAAWFGAQRIGAIDVGLNVGLKGDLLVHQVGLCGATTMVTDRTGLARLAAVADRLPDLRTVLVADLDGDGAADGPAPVGTGSGHAAPTLDGVDVVDLATALAGADTDRPDHRADPTSPAGILFTSGTTGPSKGVVRSHVADFTLARAYIDIMGLGDHETMFTAFPLFHLNAKFNSVLPALLLDDSRVVLHDRFSASRFWDVCRDQGVTIFNFMGALLTMLMKQPERAGDRDHQVRCAYGAPAPIELFHDFVDRFGVQLVEVYGSTESGIVTNNTVTTQKPGWCGVEADHYEVAIHDNDGHPVPDGNEGEIVVRPRHPSVLFSGYWGMPEATLAAWRDLWFHSGDRGVRDADGTFRFVDRMKDAIRRRGENISSWEVESSLLAHPDITEAAVIGVPSDLTEEEVMAVLVVREGADLAPEAVLDFAQERLPHFAVPRYLRVVDVLPRTPSARVEKFRLRSNGITVDTWDREDVGYVVHR